MARIIPGVLKKLRENKGLSQQDLADRAKVDKQTIWRIEAGAKTENTRPTTIQKIARLLGVEPAVLTGDAPMPDLAPTPQMSSTNIRLSRRAHNALHLVSERYCIAAWQVMELAPLLFCWAAETSLRQRQQRLEEIEALLERARSLESENRHLPTANFTYSEDKLVAESESIRANDIFGGLIEHEELLDSHGLPDDEDNPFSVFLEKVIGDLGNVAEFDGFSPVDYPSYRVCPEEASRLVAGDEMAAQRILDGIVLLSEMPKDIRGFFGDVKKRVEWVHAQAEQYRSRLVSAEDIFNKQKEPSR
jgi:transcriptional regulator with XRE-family HTH domain